MDSIWALNIYLRQSGVGKFITTDRFAYRAVGPGLIRSAGFSPWVARSRPTFASRLLSWTFAVTVGAKNRAEAAKLVPPNHQLLHVGRVVGW